MLLSTKVFVSQYLSFACSFVPTFAQTQNMHIPDESTLGRPNADEEVWIAPTSHEIIPKRFSRNQKLDMVAPRLFVGPLAPRNLKTGSEPPPCDFRPYMNELQKRVNLKCAELNFKPKTTIAIRFRIRKDSTIYDVQLAKSGNNAKEDAVAKEIIKELGLPKLPRADDEVQIEYTFGQVNKSKNEPGTYKPLEHQSIVY